MLVGHLKFPQRGYGNVLCALLNMKKESTANGFRTPQRTLSDTSINPNNLQTNRTGYSI